jgi:hypothetical protein
MWDVSLIGATPCSGCSAGCPRASGSKLHEDKPKVRFRHTVKGFFTSSWVSQGVCGGR